MSTACGRASAQDTDRIHSARVLLVLRSVTETEVYLRALQKVDLEVIVSNNRREALQLLTQWQPSVVVLDLDLSDVKPVDMLTLICHQAPSAAVVAIAGNASLNRAIEAMRVGAYDYLVKPFSTSRLIEAIRGAFPNSRRMRSSDQEGQSLQSTLMIGSSKQMEVISRVIRMAAVSMSASVFITGESGTGKEICAESIHRFSNRREGPFVAINCSAMPKDLVESELFGHVKGAFTGAASNHCGAVFQANGGTLFLDEICEMDISLQAKLLRFLQNGAVRRVGASTEENVDVRIICATNCNPLVEVHAKRFREDLYYRLHVIPIHLPPLRDRDNDVVEIARALLVRYSIEEKKNFRCLAPCAEAALAAYAWPGNVRQLQNVMRAAVVLNDGEELTATALSIPSTLPENQGHVAPPSAEVAEVERALGPQLDSQDTARRNLPDVTANNSIRSLAEVEQEAIEAAIRLCDNNITRAAAALGVSPSTIYRKRLAWAAEERYVSV